MMREPHTHSQTHTHTLTVHTHTHTVHTHTYCCLTGLALYNLPNKTVTTETNVTVTPAMDSKN